MHNTSFILSYTLNINNYDVKLYTIDSDVIDIDYINNNLATINNLTIPSQMVEYLQEINGVSKIEIYDNNTLVLNSSKILP